MSGVDTSSAARQVGSLLVWALITGAIVLAGCGGAPFAASPTATVLPAQRETDVAVTAAPAQLAAPPTATTAAAQSGTAAAITALPTQGGSSETSTAALAQSGTAVMAAAPTEQLCPQATPETLQVQPVRSPTDQLSQTIQVRVGNFDTLTVRSEAGVFTATGTRSIEVALLPNTVNTLEVTVSYNPSTDSTGCRYGGYSLSTNRDWQGDPLTIVQGQPAPRQASAVISPSNAAGLQRLLTLPLGSVSFSDTDFLTPSELAVAEGPVGIAIIDAASGAQRRVLGDPSEGFAVLAVAPDGAALATGGPAIVDGLPALGAVPVRLWDAASGQPQILGTHTSSITSLAFSPDSSRLASGSNDNEVKIWQRDPPKLLRTLRGEEGRVLESFTGLRWLDQERLVAPGSLALYWWDSGTGDLIERVPKPDAVQFFVRAAVSRGGDRVFAVAQDAALYVWNRGAGWSAWPAPAGQVLRSAALDPTERLVATGSAAGDILIWDTATGGLLVTLQIGGEAGLQLRFSPDGRYLVSSGWQEPIRVFGLP